LAGSFLQLLLGHYSVRIGYQREQNYTEIVLKQCFSNFFIPSPAFYLRYVVFAPSLKKQTQGNHCSTSNTKPASYDVKTVATKEISKLADQLLQSGVVTRKNRV